jgi:phosphate uptake regulator
MCRIFLEMHHEALKAFSHPKSDRIKEIEDRIKIIDRAIEWMEKQIAAYLSGK